LFQLADTCEVEETTYDICSLLSAFHPEELLNLPKHQTEILLVLKAIYSVDLLF